MKRIAITGSNRSGRSNLAQAFSAISGIGIITDTPYSLIAAKYGIDRDIEKCQWPDSFLYCLGAFTQRMMIEQKYVESYISDGGVFQEISWLKCRFPHIDPIYERSMIRCLEKIISDYASNEYDFIFHIDSNDASDAIDHCLKQHYRHSRINHYLIDGSDKKEALNQMLDYLQIKSALSVGYSQLKVDSLLGS